MKHTKWSFPIALIWLGIAVAHGADLPRWPAFRGQNSSGVSATAKPPVKFGPNDNVLWKIDVPWSPSSPCVWGDRIFLTTFAGGKLETRCYSRADGKLLWTRVAPAETLEEFHPTDSSPAAATPVTDGQHVVSYFGSFGLVCYDFAGKELWRHPLPVAETLGGYGSGTSPLLAGSLVILCRDMVKNSTLLAVTLSTGKKEWETPRPEANSSFGAPVLWNDNGVEEIVTSGSALLRGYDVKTGAERWRVTGVTHLACTTPVVAAGMLFFAGWAPGKADSPWPEWSEFAKLYDKNNDGIVALDEFEQPMRGYIRGMDLNFDGRLTKEELDQIKSLAAKAENTLVAVRPGGRGDITESHVVWKATRGLPYVPSALYYDGRVYLVKDGGLVSSFDAKTGKAYYLQERVEAVGNYYASPVAADGRIYIASLDGKVTVFKAGGDKPEVLHQVEFGERIASTPALVEKKLYLRTAGKLYAFGR